MYGEHLSPPADACVLATRPEVPGRTRLVGFGYWRRYSRSTLRPQADLERLAVATEFNGRGIGRALVRELIRTARDAGCEQLTIDFRGDNHSAERLYLSEGFTEYGRLRDFVAPDAARRFDKVFQVLDLRRP
jgi:Acetyltransferases